MARFVTALVLALPMTVACLDGQLHSSAEDGPRATGMPLADRVANARRALPGAPVIADPRSALDVELGRPVGPPPNMTVDDGWLYGSGGGVNELGGVQEWTATVGALGWDSVQQVVRYSANQVLVVGWIEGEVGFGGACGIVAPGMRTETEPFVYASYVARFSDAGVCQWIDTFDSDDAWPVAVAVDAALNVFVVGMFNSEVRFGPGFDLATAGNAYDVFIARYDDKGVLGWTRSITGPSDTWAYDVAPIEDGDGADAIVVGSFNGSVTIGGTTLTSAGGYDMLAVRYTAAGDVSFASGFGGEGTEELYAVVAVGSDVVAGGYFDSPTLAVGESVTLNNLGSYDAALLKLGSTGAPVWAQRFGGEGGDWISDITVAGDGIGVVGAFSGTMSIAGLSELTSAETSAFIARISGAGTGVWSHAVSSANGGALFTSVRANAAGDLYVATVIDGDASFGSTLISPAAGAWSIVAARYSAGGSETPTWTAHQDRSGQMTYPVLGISDKYVVLSADLLDNGGDMAFYGILL